MNSLTPKESEKEHQFADNFIKEMKEKGLTPDEMLKVLAMARKKFKLKNKQ